MSILRAHEQVGHTVAIPIHYRGAGGMAGDVALEKCAAVDALVHAFESYNSKLSNELVNTKKRALEVEEKIIELEEDNKNLSKQIGDKNNFVQKLREQGII